MSVKSREEKIRNLVPQIVPLVTKNGRITSADVKSPSGKWYQISLSNMPKKVKGVYEYSCTCNEKKPTFAGLELSFTSCKGNSNGTVCYHSIATLIKRAEAKGYVIEFPSAYENVRTLAKRIDGCIIKLKSNQGAVWLVGKKVMKSTPALVSAEVGIEMMRGSKKEID